MQAVVVKESLTVSDSVTRSEVVVKESLTVVVESPVAVSGAITLCRTISPPAQDHHARLE